MDKVDDFLNSLFPQFHRECKGKLTVKQAVEGIKIVVENAEDLLDDSLILFKSGKYPRAIALAIMAGEEISKIDIIKKILLSDQLAAKSWIEFKNHRSKNHSWYYPVLKNYGVSKKDVFEFIGNESLWVKRIDDLKNRSLYASCSNENSKIEWGLPKTIISKDFCRMFLVVAAQVVKDDRILWSEKALEIFKEYHYLEGKEIMSTSPIKFYKELLNLNLITLDRFKKIEANFQN